MPGPLGAALDSSAGEFASSGSKVPATADSAAADAPVAGGGTAAVQGATGNRRMLRNYQTREQEAAARALSLEAAAAAAWKEFERLNFPDGYHHVPDSLKARCSCMLGPCTWTCSCYACHPTIVLAYALHVKARSVLVDMVGPSARCDAVLMQELLG